MLWRFRHGQVLLIASIALLFASGGCTSIREYVHNGFKVGPNYAKPDAPVADQWIDSSDARVRNGSDDLARWWTVFNDPTLDYLIQRAYRQNLTLKEAGFRILEARALLAVAKGEIFPQAQNMDGGYTRFLHSDNWDFGFGLSWELDFWGKYRRMIAANTDLLDRSVENYDAAVVTLLSDVATNYVTIRSYQTQIRLQDANVKSQKGILAYIESRFNAGFKVTALDKEQAISNLRQTEAQIPQFENNLRQFENALCVLLGMPPQDLDSILGDGPIPTTPSEVVIGIPADLLRRRPDVRAAERTAAAQAENIGIAETDFYPSLSLSGSMGWDAANFKDLFDSSAFSGNVGPSFNWKLLNYGRILNGVRYEEFRFQEFVTAYQQAVLTANKEVENGLINFLRSQERTQLLDESVAAAEKAVKIVIHQYKVGSVDFNRYALIEQNLVTQQNQAATARANIAFGLISVYTAMGGGWEIRLSDEDEAPLPPVNAPGTQTDSSGEEIPVPATDAPAVEEKDDMPAPPEELPKTHADVTAPTEKEKKVSNDITGALQRLPKVEKETVEPPAGGDEAAPAPKPPRENDVPPAGQPAPIPPTVQSAKKAAPLPDAAP